MILRTPIIASAIDMYLLSKSPIAVAVDACVVAVAELVLPVIVSPVEKVVVVFA